MKKSTIFLLLVIFFRLSAADPAAFPGKFLRTLEITDETYRSTCLTELLTEYPDRIDRIFFPLCQIPVHKYSASTVTMLKTLQQQHPDDFRFAALYFYASRKDYGFIPEFFEKCVTSGDIENYVIIIDFLSKEFLQKSRKDGKFAAAEKFIGSINQRFTAPPPEVKFILLRNILDYYWFAAWETCQSAPHRKSWKRVEDTHGYRKKYEAVLQEIIQLEPVLPFPYSAALLELYNRHRSPRAAEYIRNASLASVPLLREEIKKTAFIHQKPALYPDREIDFLTRAQAFNDFAGFDAVTAKLPAAKALEMKLIKAVLLKKYDDAVLLAKEIVNAENFQMDITLNFIVVPLFYHRDRELVRRVVRYLHEHPKSLNADNANSVGYIAAVLGVELESAEKFIQYALKENPDSAAILDSAAYVSYRRGKYQEAEKYMIRALENLTPTDNAAPICLHAAEIQLALGQRDAAAGFLAKALKFAADDDEEFDHERARELQRLLR